MIILRAITTKYLGPTNSNGSRVKATAHSGAGGSLIHHWDYGIANDQPGVSDVEGNHVAAAKALAERLGGSGEWMMGRMPNDEGYAFVRASVENPDMRSAGSFAFTVPAWAESPKLSPRDANQAHADYFAEQQAADASDDEEG